MSLLSFETELLIIGIILLIFSVISSKKKLLNPIGIIFADLVGIITYYRAGLTAFIALALFYIVAETATNFSRKDTNKHEQRTSANILGNSGAAVIALLFGQVTPFFGAISAALSDTVSSEIGMLSKKKPVLITNFKKVETGTDGAITLLGTLAGLGAAIIIGGYYFFFVQSSLEIAGILIAAGFTGSIVDSLLGATLERKGLLSNAAVNFLASSSGAILVFLLI